MLPKMRNILCLLVLAFTMISIKSVVNGQSATSEATATIRVVSYNIRLDTSRDSLNAWSFRKEKVATLLSFNGADIFCVQEALANQIADLAKAFPEFDNYGLAREDSGPGGGEHNPIFYNRSKFRMLSSGTSWLSDTPDIPGSKSPSAALPRIVSWVELQDIATGKIFYIFNTHFDHIGGQARIEAAEVVTNLLSMLPADARVILTGDFNTTPDTEPITIITHPNNKIPMTDSRQLAQNPPLGPDFTFAGWQLEGDPGNTIDFIFVSKPIQVIYHVVIATHSGGFYPSDHLPVLVELAF
jgi:endonuclease/exonuclease/phosphatase family metal-dependent hydrolase